MTEADGHPAAVLIRALEPLDGIALMTKRRAPDGRAIDEHDLCRGPGNLTRALGITLADNRLDLSASQLTIEDRGISVGEVARGPRIGIRVAVERPWRCSDRERVVAPDLVEQLLSRDDQPLVAHQVLEQLELALRELDLALAAEDLVRVRVEREVADASGAMPRGGRRRSSARIRASSSWRSNGLTR